MTIAELLALHPWPAGWADASKIERLWVYELPCTPEVLWPHVADSSRMNRALGLAPMTFVERDGKRHGASKPGGVEHAWIEEPWDWVANQWLTCVRRYSKGFMKVMYAIHHVEPTATGSRLYLYFGGVARGWFGSLAMRLGFPSIKKAYDRVLPALGAQLDRLRPPVLDLPPPELSEEAEARLAGQRTALVEQGLDRACVDALIDWIRTGDDPDLHRIQILERARAWKVDEHELLRVALHATRAGVLSLSWDTVCPHCRGVRDENGTLASLAAESHCATCDVDFTTDTQESVEVTFRVHPSVRDVPEVLYCSAEPARKDHIRVQHTLAPKQRVTVAPSLAPGRYVVRAGKTESWYLDVDQTALPSGSAAGTARADVGASTVAWAPRAAGTVVKAQRAATLELANDTDEPTRVVIEEARWRDHALRAGHLLSFQDFRDLFSEEYIGADVRLFVGEQTLLFTDVVGSTAFYAQRGDPGAFIEIKKHFDEVFAIVGANNGAVVKTIGDAVMATFTNPADAVRASFLIHRAFHPVREDSPIRLRISLNTGPCIAVRLNSNADYFGGTVNIAAKLQALAEGHQIAMAETTYRAPGVAEFMTEHGAVAEPMTYTSKALVDAVQVRRWTVFP